ncbi:Oligopeptide transport system permease protein OppC (TC 3.A.1.5.1) [hydrothermal vent metagenome]|uniref:Oligopeptide transport system permease protein OppC n=1 Tax=hydrothermal vent metagenome TaxID=652676 RepID=A0A3B0ZG55_9ZZZZ
MSVDVDVLILPENLPESTRRRVWLRLKQNRAALVSIGLIVTVIVAALIGPMLSSYTIEDIDYDAIAVAPSFTNGHLFGTDSLGRDLFVRTMEGSRISLLIGLVATIVSLIIGIHYGAIAGYYGGRVDAVMMRIVDILYSMPFMFFVILLMVFFGRNIYLIFIAIGAINWLDIARIVRGQTLSLKQQGYVEAARIYGASHWQIIRRHIIPNLFGIVIVYITLTIPQVILIESFLSFLGLGIQEPMTSLGALVSDGAEEMESSSWMLIFPALFLSVLLFCFNFIGDGLRDAIDPKQVN